MIGLVTKFFTEQLKVGGEESKDVTNNDENDIDKVDDDDDNDGDGDD